MISYLTNNNGFIYAYISYFAFDSEGRLRRNGEYGYIQDIWIHPDKRRKGVMKDLIAEAKKFFKGTNVKYIYWRNKKHKRVTKSYNIERLQKLGGTECYV